MSDSTGQREVAVCERNGAAILLRPGHEAWDSLAYDLGDELLRLIVVSEWAGHKRLVHTLDYVHGPGAERASFRIVSEVLRDGNLESFPSLRAVLSASHVEVIDEYLERAT